jgi:uncharacterized membrane protein
LILVSTFALGCNKQLDLQTLLTDTLREVARSMGWYKERRAAQLAFVVAIFVAAVAVAISVIRVTRTSHLTVKLASAGLLILVSYVFVRAASFHHLDQVMRLDIGGLRWVWLLEFAGALLICASAAWFAYLQQRGRTAS